MSRILLLLGAACVCLSGCATPHRISESTHTLKKYQGRGDGLVSVESWQDYHKAGASFFFEDPSSQGFYDTFTNQAALGGGSYFMAAPFSSIVDSNLVLVIPATGTALGNIAGAAVKAAIK